MKEGRPHTIAECSKEKLLVSIKEYEERGFTITGDPYFVEAFLSTTSFKGAWFQRVIPPPIEN